MQVSRHWRDGITPSGVSLESLYEAAGSASKGSWMTFPPSLEVTRLGNVFQALGQRPRRALFDEITNESPRGANSNSFQFLYFRFELFDDSSKPPGGWFAASDVTFGRS